ncbi:MAG TPA: 5-formyltetrahydrofolate cyclo-ligase [Chthoniobacteraceae bacterium]|nr:5-formyltetrahydrofolate cyclo-ligase [Chthoniobacteraceae bacterium]
MNSKADVRKLIRTLPPMSAHARAESSRRICERIRGDAGWRAARTIAFFAAQSSEPDIELLWDDLGTRVVCYPRVQEDTLQFFRVSHPSVLIAGRWGLREPGANGGAAVDPAEIDLILVPGVAFTEEGFRVGRGGGYYDRWLAQAGVRARKLGVCFARQLLPTVPLEPHDQRVDRVLAA